MVEFADASIEELIRATRFLHHVKPTLRDKLVCAIEKSQPFDRNIVFHLIKRKVEEAQKRSEEDTELFILSAEYIKDHPFWKGFENGESNA
jgi:hypothetical protein